ncbi:MAG: NUDIX hydrolase [Erysipelotrichaceae bacterium]
MIIAELNDPTVDKPISYTDRVTVRVFAFNKNNELAILYIKGEDEFGIRHHYETIGGGVEPNESFEAAIKREVMEEIGLDCTIISSVGTIIDYYNLIGRRTISNYFVVELLPKQYPLNRTEEELTLDMSLKYISVEQALKELTYNNVISVNELIQRRDARALKYYLKHKK